jgi:hypothetical protein
VAISNEGKITLFVRRDHHAYSGVALAIWQADLAFGAGRALLTLVFAVRAKTVGAGDESLGERFSSSGLGVPAPVFGRSPVGGLISVRR